MDLFIKIVAFLYGIGGIATIIGYIPTIKDLWQKKPSANLQTYIIRTATTLFTSFYGFLVLKNTLFNFVINAQLVACIVILVLRIRLQINKKV